MFKTDVSIRPADVCRTTLLALFVLWVMAPAATAQTAVIINPGSVEFTPSADHSQTAGGVGLVSGYTLRLYQLGSAQPFHEMNMGKPAPGTDGQIRVDVTGSLASWPLPGGTYEARVAAVGPGGIGLSDRSNPFTVSSCSVALSRTGGLFPSAGGGGTVDITTGSDCSWTATPTASWIAMATSSGVGSGSAIFSVTANTATVPRSAAVMVENVAYQVDQEAACAFALSSAGHTFAAAGGTASVGVTTGAGCTWTALPGAAWIVPGSGGGSGTGSLTYQVMANTGVARTATMTIAGRPYTVSQGSATEAPPPPPPPSTLPAPWAGQDIGAVGLQGAASFSSGVFNVSAAGAGIDGSLDSFYLLSQPLGAATTVTARIASLGPGGVATAGLTLRDGTAANAAHVSLLARAGGVVEFVQRSGTGGSTSVRASTPHALPGWLRLVRSGGKVTASVSVDGQTWTTLGSRAIKSTRFVVGVAASSGDTASLTTVTVDNVLVR